MMFEYEIGISCASEQGDIAFRFYEILKNKGISVFWSGDENNTFVAQNLYGKIVETYEKKCRYIVAIISNEYTKKDYTRQELSIAKERVAKGDYCLIPIYTDDCRSRVTKSNLHYFDLSKQTEYEIASRIYSFLTNNISNENNISNKNNIEISREFQIFISGATGVGKSTIARQLLMTIPQFVLIEEADMLREAIRSENDRIVEQIVSHFNGMEGINRESLQELLRYDILKKSTIDLQYDDINEQCKLILEPLERVCFRLMDKGMPTIIEGVNLSFAAMFEDSESSYSTFLDDNNKLFLNFYLSNQNEHKERLKQRSEERREDARKRQRYMQRFQNIRRTNDQMQQKAQEYANNYSNVYNIDTTGTPDNVVEQILNILKNNKIN